MKTYDVSTRDLLAKYGSLHCAKWGTSYTKVFDNVPKGVLRSNHVHFQVREPLIDMDIVANGGVPRKRTSTAKSTPKVLCEQLTRSAWIALWDNAHTNPYQKIAQAYADKTIASMNQV